METVVIKFNVDRNSLNKYLGNTSNVSIEQGMTELCEMLFSYVYASCDRCGHGATEETHIKGDFEILKDIDT